MATRFEVKMNPTLEKAHKECAERAKEKILAYLAKRDIIKMQLDAQLMIINRRVPGTIRKAQKRFRELRKELQENIWLTDAWRNGGIW
jgi:hypothetical protein